MTDADEQMEGASLAVGVGVNKGSLELPDRRVVTLSVLQTSALKEVVTGGGRCARETVKVEGEVRRCTGLHHNSRTAAWLSNDRGLVSGDHAAVSGNYALPGSNGGIDGQGSTRGEGAMVRLHGRAVAQLVPRRFGSSSH
jgi:hypothetical protein